MWLFILLICLGLTSRPAEAEDAPLVGTAPVHPYTTTTPPTDAIMLTRPDGTPIWVNPHAVAFIRGPLPGETGHTTLVFTSGAKQTVVESVDEIRTIMSQRRRDLD